jgi:biotin operon repressor
MANQKKPIELKAPKAPARPKSREYFTEAGAPVRKSASTGVAQKKAPRTAPAKKPLTAAQIRAALGISREEMAAVRKVLKAAGIEVAAKKRTVRKARSAKTSKEMKSKTVK